MSIDSYRVGFTLIAGCVVVAMFGLWLIRRKADPAKLKSSHEVGGYMLSVIGTMYAVLLGLVVVDAMSKFQTASNISEQEANSLADIFLLSSKFPEKQRLEIQTLCFDYADLVVNKEWQLMDDSKICIPARKDAIKLIKVLNSIEPSTESEKAIYPIIIQEALQLWDNRRARTNFATNGLPTVEWVVLIIGACATVIFTYFFSMEYFKVQLCMTGSVALLIGLNLYLVLLFGCPFSGDLKVYPSAMKVDLLIFNDQLGMNRPGYRL